MQLFLVLLLISLTTVNASSQDSASKAFLYGFFGDSAKIVFMDKLWKEQINHMEDALSRDTLFTLGGRMNEPNDRLILTRQERSYIQNELKQQANLAWPSQLFENGKLLTKAVIDSIYSDRTITGSWSYFKARYGARLYSFSHPIFIRNHSLCIFYSGYSCGSRCGEGKLMIFRKQGETWLAWLELYRWMS